MNLDWMLIRGTGIVAYALLAASTIWGLMLSSKLFGRLVKAKPLTWLHEGLAVGSLLATGAHMFFLWTDEFIEFGGRELFIPGASTWEPLSVAFGIMAFYAMLIVSASFYVKKWIGQAAWRTIHFMAFGTFAAAAIHGVVAGTDTQQPAVLGMYVATVAIVVLLLMLRITQEAAATSPSGTPREPAVAQTAPARATRPPVDGDDEASADEMGDRLAALQARRAGSGAAAPSRALAPAAVLGDGASTGAADVSTDLAQRIAAVHARNSSHNGGEMVAEPRPLVSVPESSVDRDAAATASRETLDRIAALRARRQRASE